VLALLAMVIVLDQATKWWAWRHVPWVRINPGGDLLVGHTISEWYVSPVSGTLLDVLNFGLLSIAVTVFARCRAPGFVVVPGTLMIAGWSSNLLDRLGMHYWTAPGSVRGAVDFIHIGSYFYNVADLFIIAWTPLFVLAAGYWGVRSAWRSAWRSVAVRSQPSRLGSRVRARMRIPALAGASLILAVALGAASYGGVHVPPPPAGKTAARHVPSQVSG
jgi:lipoprotein signal peptidase